MEEVKYVHYSLPLSREERVIEKLDLLIEKKLQERKMKKERQERLFKEILKLKNKYFPKNVEGDEKGNEGDKEKTIAITKIIVGNFLIIQKEAVVIDGVPIENTTENTEAEIDVEKILELLQRINEADVIII